MQYEDGLIDNFKPIPKTLNEVEKYLSTELNLTDTELLSYYNETVKQCLSFKSSYISWFLQQIALKLSKNSLELLSNKNKKPKIDYWALDSTYLIIMKVAQPLLANFHDQLCPKSLTFDGMLSQLCSGDIQLNRWCHDTKLDIFGDQRQRQTSMLDSFIPATMTREECGFLPRSLYKSFNDQLRCAYLRGKLSELEKNGCVPKHLAIIVRTF